MPSKALKPCAYPRCKNYATNKGYCQDHQQQTRQYDKERGTSYQRGYDAKWRKAREYFLSQNPLCVMCQQQGRITPANVVDHIQPHKGNQDLFWDEANWQALCQSCHNSKTAKEDMGQWLPSNKNN